MSSAKRERHRANRRRSTPRAPAAPELDPADVDQMLTSVWRYVESGQHFTLDMYADIVRMAREQGYV